MKGRNGKGDESAKLTGASEAPALIPEVPMGLLALLLSRPYTRTSSDFSLGTIRLATEF